MKAVAEYMHDAYDLPDFSYGLIKIRTEGEYERRLFSVEESVHLLRCCETLKEKLVFLSLYGSTCRIKELANLKIENILEDKIVTFGKTGRRVYSLDKEVCEQLKVYGTEYGEDGYVFRVKEYKLRKEEVLNRVVDEDRRARALDEFVRRFLIRNGMTGKKLGPHTIRHSMATLVGELTRDPYTVQKWLRHTDLGTSQKYVHIGDDDRKGGNSLLGMLASQFKGSNEAGISQLHLGDGSGKVVAEQGASMAVVENMMASSFPEIPDGVEVRSLLKDEDLRLLVRFMKLYPGATADVVAGRELIRRMLRKVKVDGRE
ncbi:MAG: tyrosine-type recombinase/integrase [Chloroflexota bacterium]